MGEKGTTIGQNPHPPRQEMINRMENEDSQNSSYALVLLNGSFRAHGVC